MYVLIIDTFFMNRTILYYFYTTGARPIYRASVSDFRLLSLRCRSLGKRETPSD